MTTLVTGGNGWLPSHVVRRLARAGETVVSYDLMEPDDYLRAFLGADMSNVVFESGDVTDRERLREAAARHGVTSMISAAAITPRVDRERREPERIIAVNLGGVVNALEVARRAAGFPPLRPDLVVRGLRRCPRRHGAGRGLAGQLDQPVRNHEAGRGAAGAALWGSLRAGRDRRAAEQCLRADGAIHAGVCRSDGAARDAAHPLRRRADQGDITRCLVSRLDLRRRRRRGDRAGLVGRGAAAAPGLHRLERRAVLDWRRAGGVPHQFAGVGVQRSFPGTRRTIPSTPMVRGRCR